jgi:nitroreductase
LHVDDALRARRSVRAFKPDPVSPALIAELLRLASLAPSGTNIQPWKVHVVMGEARARLEREVLAHRETLPVDDSAEFPRQSKRMEPYIGRMRKVGKDMYGLIGIPRGDQAAGWAQWGRNYKFFDAPVGLIFTIDKALDRMSYLIPGSSCSRSCWRPGREASAPAHKAPGTATGRPRGGCRPFQRTNTSSAASRWAMPTRPRR